MISHNKTQKNDFKFSTSRVLLSSIRKDVINLNDIKNTKTWVCGWMFVTELRRNGLSDLNKI